MPFLHAQIYSCLRHTPQALDTPIHYIFCTLDTSCFRYPRPQMSEHLATPCLSHSMPHTLPQVPKGFPRGSLFVPETPGPYYSIWRWHRHKGVRRGCSQPLCLWNLHMGRAAVSSGILEPTAGPESWSPWNFLCVSSDNVRWKLRYRIIAEETLTNGTCNSSPCRRSLLVI